MGIAVEATAAGKETRTGEIGTAPTADKEGVGAGETKATQTTLTHPKKRALGAIDSWGTTVFCKGCNFHDTLAHLGLTRATLTLVLCPRCAPPKDWAAYQTLLNTTVATSTTATAISKLKSLITFCVAHRLIEHPEELLGHPKQGPSIDLVQRFIIHKKATGV